MGPSLSEPIRPTRQSPRVEKKIRKQKIRLIMGGGGGEDGKPGLHLGGKNL
jgi:hypothetical protein